MKSPGRFIADVFRGREEHDLDGLSAALAFYGALSAAPLLLVAIYLAGVFLGRETVSGDLFLTLERFVGGDAARLLQSAVSRARPDNRSYPLAIGAGVTLLAASALFERVRHSLRLIHGAPPEEGIRGYLRRGGVPVLLVAGFGLLIVPAIEAYSLLTLVPAFRGRLPLWAEESLSLAVLTGVFGLAYRHLSGVPVRRSSAALGAFVAALLFAAGRFLLAWYFSRAAVVSLYGAGGSLIVLLLWFYWSSQAFLLGAEVTRVHARPPRGK
jgi:membrane protein